MCSTVVRDELCGLHFQRPEVVDGEQNREAFRGDHCRGNGRAGTGGRGGCGVGSEVGRFLGHASRCVGCASVCTGLDDGPGPSFNGTHGSNNGRGPDSNLSWSSWGASGASGNGDLWLPRERGTSISWKRYPAKLSFSAPKTLSFATDVTAATHRSALVFTRVTVSFSGAVPAHWRRSASFTLKRFEEGFYGFGFPI